MDSCAGNKKESCETDECRKIVHGMAVLHDADEEKRYDVLISRSMQNREDEVGRRLALNSFEFRDQSLGRNMSKSYTDTATCTHTAASFLRASSSIASPSVAPSLRPYAINCAI